MKRREFLTSSTAATLGILTGTHAASSAAPSASSMKRPNILMITCHDIGQHLGCYGVDTVQTHNLDKLASKGVRFDNMYSTSAVCSPGRASLHTGRYPQSNGLMGLTHAPWWWKLKDTERHTAEILKALGYDTYLIGFNHIADAKRLGYENILSKRRRAPETVQAARDLIQSAKPETPPFFAKVGFTEVHRKFTHGRDTTRGVFVPPWLQGTEDMKDDLAAFQATIKYFDERVGEILDTLESSDIAENTLVIMTSDHGIPYPGAKWTARKAGIEVPLILYQPNTVFDGGKVQTEVMSYVDVLPTVLDFLQVNVPENMEGVSFMPFLQGKAKTPPRAHAFAQYTPDMKRDNLSRCVITDKYHLIRYFDQGRSVDYPVAVHPQTFASHQQRCRTKGTRPFVQLFDIQNDPYELEDIGSQAKYAPVVRELSQSLLAWMKQVKDPLLEGPLRTPYYDRAMTDLQHADQDTPGDADKSHR
jgi:N-sulfoglucosamine sulfohydrolase